MKNNFILLKALLKSTSSLNFYKYSTDKKKKGRVVGRFIALGIIYIMIIGYSIAMSIGYGELGLIEETPVLCGLLISLLSFILTFFKTNGYLFNFKEYDMLMSLPFEAKTVAGCKFLYMYIKSLPTQLSVSFAMLIGYGYYAKPPVYAYFLWVILSFFLPLIPMLIASAFGFLIARLSVGFKKKNIVQTVLTFIFVIFCFSLRFIIESIFRNDEVENVLGKTSEITGNIAKYYQPVNWFSGAVKGNFLYCLLLIAVSVLLFSALFYIVGNSYRKINSALKSHSAKKNYKMTVQKKRSLVNTIAFKEFKRMTSSTVYITNVGIGEVLAILVSTVTLIFGFDKIVAAVTQNAPFDAAVLRPAIPFLIYFFIGMISTTACSPSLEGKNYWILQSLPIDSKTVYNGKMLFNMYLTVPFMTVSVLFMCIAAKVPVIETVLYIILGISLCAFSTAWGCVCGVKHMKIDWENEIEVVKQGAAVTLYVLPNMLACMGLIAIMIFLGINIDHRLLAAGMTVIVSLLAFFSYLRVMALAKRRSV